MRTLEILLKEFFLPSCIYKFLQRRASLPSQNQCQDLLSPGPMLHLERGLRGLIQHYQMCGMRHHSQCHIRSTILESSRQHAKRRRLQSTGKEHAQAGESHEKRLEKLQSDLKEAISSEDYQGAAGLRDLIQRLEGEDPVKALRVQLQAAVDAQDYAKAIRCRDELEKLAPKPKPKVPTTPPPPTKSDTITNGIRIQVKSSFLPHRSRPGQYVFMYQVRIKNQMADTTVKLHSRHWLIEDANGFCENVRGDGVLGEQPEIAPEKEYAYSSSVPMRTPTGKMSGSYQMQVKDSQGTWQDAFDASVGVFGLSMSDSTPL